MAREPSGPLRVAVIGAGVIGLSVAVHLTEKLGSQVAVTVIADKYVEVKAIGGYREAVCCANLF